MRTAILVNSLPSISEKFILNHIVGEIISGVDITVFAAHKGIEHIHHSLYDKFNIERKTIFANIPRSVIKRLVLSPLLFFKLFFKNPSAAIEALRIHTYQIAAKNCKLLYFGLCFSGKHYNTLHCHFGMNGLIGAYLKKCGFCDTVITTFHGADINFYPKKYGKDMYRAVYRESDSVTANTSFTKAKLVANGCPSEKIEIIPVGLFVNDFIMGWNVIPNSVLTVGRLEEKKGYKYSLEAIKMASKTINSIQYYIIGAGALHDELVKYAEELGIIDRCHFLGICAEDEVKEYYQKCSVFLLSSVTAANGDMEGQGLVLQEAQASGIPVISTVHNGIPEGVLANKSGFLVPERDSEALAEKIIILLQNEQLRKEMGEAGRKFVEEKYDMAIIVKRLNELYSSFIGRHYE
jgi:colanic acid/amylovoran biosynthesis glycosyltransferase